MFRKILLISLLVTPVVSVSAQTRTGLGLSYSINQPLSEGYTPGHGYNFSIAARLSPKLALTPSDGIDHLNGNGKTVTRDYVTWYRSDLDVLYAGVGLRYAPTATTFIRAQPVLHLALGDGDISGGGIGGSIGAGRVIHLGSHGGLELSGNIDLVNTHYRGGRIAPVAGVRLGYWFWFGKPR